MKKFLLTLLLVVPGSFVYAIAAPITNAGFVPANIWYSKDPFYAGDTVRIYTIIFNGKTYDLTGSAEFLDNGTVIGTTSFSIAGNGRVQDVWVDWKATEGTHIITARLVNVVADGPNGKQIVSLDNSETGKSERVITVDPAIAAAEAQAQAQKAAVAGAQVVDTVKNAANTIDQSIPAPVKESVTAGANLLESFRAGEGAQIQLAKENKAKEISAMNATSSTKTTTSKVPKSAFDTAANAAEKPFAYVMLAILTVMQYFFQWPIVFYGVIAYAVYRFLKWGINKIRNRE